LGENQEKQLVMNRKILQGGNREKIERHFLNRELLRLLSDSATKKRKTKGKTTSYGKVRGM